MVDIRVIKIKVVNDYINIMALLQRNYFWLFFVSLSVGFFGVAPFEKTQIYVDPKLYFFVCW